MAMEADMRVKVFIIVQHFYEEYFLPFTSETDAVCSRKDHINSRSSKV
jgi:hypothetical protein